MSQADNGSTPAYYLGPGRIVGNLPQANARKGVLWSRRRRTAGAVLWPLRCLTPAGRRLAEARLK
jgi:hypothetical protein